MKNPEGSVTTSTNTKHEVQETLPCQADSHRTHRKQIFRKF